MIKRLFCVLGILSALVACDQISESKSGQSAAPASSQSSRQETPASRPVAQSTTPQARDATAPPPRLRAARAEENPQYQVFDASNKQHRQIMGKFLQNYRIEDLCYRYSVTYPFTLRGTSENRARIQRAEALVAGEILSRTTRQEPYGWNRSVDLHEYSLTDKGVALLNDNYELCYGQVIIERVRKLDVQERERGETKTIVDVIVDTRADVVGKWVRNPLLSAFFPVPDARTATITLEHDPNRKSPWQIFSR